MDKKTQIAVIAGTVLLVALMMVLAIWSGKGSAKNLGAETATTTATTTVEVSSKEGSGLTGLQSASLIPKNNTPGLSVADQVAGEFVAVTNLDVDADTWVVVYDERDGQPAWVMGAGLELLNSKTPKTIAPLVRKTEGGKRYYVALIKDDGDHEFDLKKDRPVDGTKVVSFMTLN